MAMHPTRFMFFIGVMIISTWILMVINPIVVWSVDPLLIISPMFICSVVLSYYFYSEGHRWAYSLVTHQSHSSTSEGKPAFTIRAQNGYPEMVGFAKGGSRLFNVYGFGGKKDGFLVVPAHHVIDVNGHKMANTVTRDISWTALPPHVKEVLMRHRRFDPRTPVEFGLVPYIKNLHREYFSKLDAPNMEVLLENAHEENHSLRENIVALKEDIRSMTNIIRDIGEGLRDVPSDTLRDRVREYARGGEDRER